MSTILEFSQKFNFAKLQQIFLYLAQTRVSALNKWKQLFKRSYRFLNQTLICVYFFLIISDDVIQCVYNWTPGTESFILIASKLQISGWKNLGGHFAPPGKLRVICRCFESWEIASRIYFYKNQWWETGVAFLFDLKWWQYVVMHHFTNASFC